MSQNRIRIATRRSALAVWQAEEVARRLEEIHPGIEVELVKIKSKGDKILDTPLAKIGGKGLFVKELEQSMLDGETDIAVHSMKDVPMEFPEGLELPVILKREDPRDAFCSNDYPNLEAMPEGSVVGTSSLRRQSQVKTRFPHLEVKWLRGNVQTRLSKLDDGVYDAIILASAGLKRLEMHDRITHLLEPEESLPSVGQGAIGIECRSSDDRVQELIHPLNDPHTAVRVTCERAMNNRLHGGCQVPIAGYCLLNGDELYLRGLVARPEGDEMIREEIRGPVAEAESLGRTVADRLLARGADKILAELGIEH